MTPSDRWFDCPDNIDLINPFDCMDCTIKNGCPKRNAMIKLGMDKVKKESEECL